MDTRGPLRRAAAFLVAGAILAAVVGWLLVVNHRAMAQRRADVLRQHAGALALQAVIVGHVLDGADAALRSAPDVHELGARMVQWTTSPGTGVDAPFERVVLLDARGEEVMAVGGPGPAAERGGVVAAPPGVSISPDGSRIRVAREIAASPGSPGRLVGTLAPEALSRALVHEWRPDGRPVPVHLVDDRGLALQPQVPGTALPRPPGALHVPPDGVAVPAGNDEAGKGLLVARVRIPGRDLSLLDVDLEEELLRDVPSDSSYAALATAVAVVLGAVALGVVVNVRSLVRRTRLEESSAREREVGEKAEALERETAERRRVERSRAVLANALEQSADAVAIADTGFRIEHVNPAFERLTGRAAGAARGRSLLDVLAPDAAATEPGRELLRAVGEGRPWSGELTGARAGGAPFDARVSVAPVRDGSGTVTHLVLSARDVTEERRGEERRRHAQKLEAIGTLAGGVAHDFNNLLTAIEGYAALALEELPPGSPVREDVEEIRRAGARAAELTRQLLAFGRRQVLDPESLDPNAVVDGIQRMIRRLIGEHVELSVDLQPGAWPVRADRGQLEQVLVNLAVNARDAMPGGGRLAVSTANVTLPEGEARAIIDGVAGEHVRIRVADTGVGMSPELVARVFEPFFTTKEPGKGTGLGLSTVHGIVKQSRGFVGVSSAPGAGTTFDVYLPRDRQPAPRPPEAGGTRSAIAGAGEVILIVEDEEQVRSLLVAQLSARGYAVLSAADGQEALRVAERRREPIHVLLADVVLPHLSGTDLARRIRRSHPETQVVLMSGHARDAVLAGEGGGNGPGPGPAFLAKPFQHDDLCALLRRLIDRGPDGPPAPPERAGSCDLRHRA